MDTARSFRVTFRDMTRRRLCLGLLYGSIRRRQVTRRFWMQRECWSFCIYYAIKVIISFMEKNVIFARELHHALTNIRMSSPWDFCMANHILNANFNLSHDLPRSPGTSPLTISEVLIAVLGYPGPLGVNDSDLISPRAMRKSVTQFDKSNSFYFRRRKDPCPLRNLISCKYRGTRVCRGRISTHPYFERQIRAIESNRNSNYINQ